ncbi:hypothetical protein K1T73_10385 [Roseovarius sp. SCSIO 43702]|uniref:hypothetical protein n=1 Tax=Roseovarius sp. SCSIO 43702 TaxID=2823043 RepID=UPI001C739CBB|nr:hypothetical protein [Roseovarius sp. SCSIO 43702]QYX55509.1 hypothetical protein K1T73_10385 [Roseovarius sp. SCSIO 43702]
MTKSKRQARRAWAAAQRKHIKRGKLFRVEFQHDPGCAIYTRERICTCDPHRVLKDDRGRTLARVEGAGEYDPLELMGGAV